MHDGRLLTLDDTLEFFNIVFELGLKPDEKADLVTFMRVVAEIHADSWSAFRLVR